MITKGEEIPAASGRERITDSEHEALMEDSETQYRAHEQKLLLH